MPQSVGFRVNLNPLMTPLYFAWENFRGAFCGFVLVTMLFCASASELLGQVNVLTYHNDVARTGQNTNETLLTPANVNTNSFGKLFSHGVDGYVYTQPLYVANLSIPGQGTHNVVFVATEHDSVYAFDADDDVGANASPLWQVSFIDPAAGVTTVPPADTGETGDLVPEIGITSTPVIDVSTGTIYVEAKTKEVAGGTTEYVHRLHALDIATGAEKFGGPVVIQATVPGTGEGADEFGQVPFVPLRQLNRPGLLLLDGVIYLGFASHGDNGPYHGWVLGYSAQTLQQVRVYNTTPNGGLGGIWQAGGGLAADAGSNIYFETGNGTFSTDSPNNAENNFGDSFVKLSTTNGLAAVDYFAPYNQDVLEVFDLDLGSAGAVVLPDAVGSGAHPHLLVGAGKEGTIYLLDRDNLGHYNTGGDTQIVQSLPGAIGDSNRDILSGGFGMPAYFDGRLYFVGVRDVLKAFRFSAGKLGDTPDSTNPTFFGFPGATPGVSANGTNDAILWVLQNDAYADVGPAVLHAYNATNVAIELYNSNQAGSRDQPGGAVKFTVPTIANGKVYVGGQYSLSVFGLGSTVAPPVITPNGGVFSSAVTVQLSSATPAADIYYTTNGASPTTNAAHYVGPFVLANTATVKARAFKAGLKASSITTANFIVAQPGSSAGRDAADAWIRALDPNNNFGTTDYLLVKNDSTQSGFSRKAYVRFLLDAGAAGTLTDAVLVFTQGQVEGSGEQVLHLYGLTWNNAPQNDTSSDQGLKNVGTLVVDLGSKAFSFDNNGTNTTFTFSNADSIDGAALVDFLNADSNQQVTFVLATDTPTTFANGFLSREANGGATRPQLVITASSNTPPLVRLASPADGATFTADSASVLISADATDPDGSVSNVEFFRDSELIATLTNSPYSFTWTKAGAGSHILTARATDNSGVTAASAPVHITIQADTGAPYGVTDRPLSTAYLNMPTLVSGALPALLSKTGAFLDVAALSPGTALVPYTVNTPLWSDGALKFRWLALPNDGPPYTPDEQINFSPTGEWSFPGGTVFVKHFELNTDESNSNIRRRLETRLLVRDAYGAVYGVTYKWRPDNSDAELLTNSLTENIVITNANGTHMQSWYYPSPTDCLTCHTPVSGYVLGVKTRQLNGDFTYPYSGQTDNQLRTLNQLGLFNPPITNERAIGAFARLSAVTNTAVSLEERARSYLDANCAQCHRPGGARANFDARYDTALVDQNIINGPVIATLGVDNAKVVMPQDIWRSLMYQRMNSLSALSKMPPLARNVIDTPALNVLGDWINSLPGTPALSPPAISPGGGAFNGAVTVTLQHADANAKLHYTADGSLPTTNSALYTAPFALSGSATVKAVATKAGFNNSIATAATFTVNQLPAVAITSPTNGASFVASTNLTLTAEASDSDGTVRVVRFFSGTNELGQATISPYRLTWSNVGAGTYTLSAQATDDRGASSTSGPVDITVHPSNLDVNSAGGKITISWPDSGVDYVLETTDGLTPPVTWSPATQQPVHAGGLVTVDIASTNRQQYYRLRP